MKRALLLAFIGFSLSACASDYYYAYGEKIKVTKLPEKRMINNSEVSYYITENGHKLGTIQEIILQCEEHIDCNATLKKYKFQSISQLSPTLYVVKIDPSENVFEFSQKLHHDSQIKFAHPNFIKEKKRR